MAANGKTKRDVGEMSEGEYRVHNEHRMDSLIDVVEKLARAVEGKRWTPERAITAVAAIVSVAGVGWLGLSNPLNARIDAEKSARNGERAVLNERLRSMQFEVRLLGEHPDQPQQFPEFSPLGAQP